MIETTQIHPLTDFLRNHKAHLARIKSEKTPEILTVNGRAEVVVMDVESFDDLARRVEKMELIQAIREGLDAAERGDMKPAEQVFDEMCARYGISR